MRRTILVADSDSRTAKLLRATLEPRGFAVVEAPDAVSILTLLLWIPVGLVVVTPRQLGSRRLNPTAFRLLGFLRRRASFARLPVVMFADGVPTADDQRMLGRCGVEVVLKLEGVAQLATRIRVLTAGYEPSVVSQRDARFMPSVMMPTR